MKKINLHFPAALLFFFSSFLLMLSCRKADSLFISSAVISDASFAGDSVITTLAGNGTRGFSGDYHAATNAQLSRPVRVCRDPFGNIYISDANNSRIRKVTPAGVITTFAGTGVGGFSGDNGPATAAKISAPAGIISDKSGNIYFADKGNGRIRRISTSGIITTVAGNGKKYSAHDGDGGPATADTVSLSLPEDIAFDLAGNLLIADYGHYRIRKVNALTGRISHFAGKQNSPVLGDGGPAVNAKLGSPNGLAVDVSGNVYVTASYRVRKIAPNGIITTFAGTGIAGAYVDGKPATATGIWPVGIAFNNRGELIIADYGFGCIRKVSANGIMSILTLRLKPLKDGGKPSQTGLDYPTGIATDPYGGIYIADYGENRIRKITVR